MNPKDRYKIERSGGDSITNLVDIIASGKISEVVTVTDTLTKNSATASGNSVEEAKRKAFEKLEKIQGPTPSESAGS